MIFDELQTEAQNSAVWVTCSPHEWVWTQAQQVAMARYVVEASRRLALWKWLTDMRCTVQENSVIGVPKWTVLDVDNDILGRGDSPEEAIDNARGDVVPGPANPVRPEKWNEVG